MFKVSYIYCTTLACLIFLFHFTKPFYSTGPTSLFLNRLIYVLFVILFNLAMIIPKNEKGKKTKKFALTKIFIVLLQTFFIEDADTIFNLVIFIPLFEYFDYVFKKIKNNKSKIFLWQFNVLLIEFKRNIRSACQNESVLRELGRRTQHHGKIILDFLFATACKNGDRLGNRSSPFWGS